MPGGGALLLGKGKEIEVDSTVLYTILPEAENNYFQGFGVMFDEIPEEQLNLLQGFIKEHFLREVSSSQNGVVDFNKDQLKA